MAGMKVDVHIDLSGMTRKLSRQNFNRGKLVMLNQMAADIDPFVPYKGGDLSTLSGISPNQTGLQYVVPYARRLYYGSPSWHWTTTVHPNAGPKWDQRAKALRINSWRQAFVKGAGL